jgi:hypothetical protein
MARQRYLDYKARERRAVQEGTNLAFLYAREGAPLESPVARTETHRVQNVDELPETHTFEHPQSDSDSWDFPPPEDFRDETNVSVEDLRYETDVSVEDLRYESDVSVADLRYESDVSVEDLRYESDVSVEDLRYESDVSVADLRYESDVSVADLRYGSDVSVADLRYETEVSVEDLGWETDLLDLEGEEESIYGESSSEEVEPVVEVSPIEATAIRIWNRLMGPLDPVY